MNELDKGVRRRRLLELLAAVPPAGAGDPAPTSLPARLGHLCSLAVSELEVSGAGVTVMASVTAGLDGHRDQLWSTSALTRALEDLQLTSGQGPCLDAYASGQPVLAGDLLAEHDRWVGYTEGALALGVRAAFSLPLRIGAAQLGTLDLHRTEAGPLSPDRLGDALTLADLATEALLELTGSLDGDAAEEAAERSPGWLPEVHASVHQASGMVAAREHIAIGPALLRIRGYAFGQSLSITEVARRVVARELVLPDPPPES